MTKRKYIGLSATALCFLYLLVFVSFYITAYLPSVRLLSLSGTTYDIIYNTTSVVEYCLPILAAVTVFALAGACVKRAILYSVLLSLPKFLYLLPYYYLYEIAYGYDSLESLGLSALISLGFIALLSLHVMLLYLLMYAVSKKHYQKELIAELPIYKQKALPENDKKELNLRSKQELSSVISAGGILDLSVPVVAGIFAAAFLDFLYLFIIECINAVIYLVSYAGTYTVDEIILMVASFIFILIKLLISHVLAVLVKNLAVRATSQSAQ